MQRRTPRTRGFTVVELVFALAVLVGLLLMAQLFVHQKDYSPQLNDARRVRDVAQLTQWLVAYRAEHGAFPDGLTDKPQSIGSDSGQLDWCSLFVPAKAKEIPYDPIEGGVLTNKNCATEGALYGTGYTVMFKDNILTVAAPGAEQIGPIQATHTF